MPVEMITIWEAVGRAIMLWYIDYSLLPVVRHNKKKKNANKNGKVVSSV